jgi:arginyl-tRNA synthetase
MSPEHPLASLRVAVGDAADNLRDGSGEVAAATLERPPRQHLGDYSSNAAMLLAASLGESPREVAERLKDRLEADLGAGLERIEVAGPGFVNLFLSDNWYRQAIAQLDATGESLGVSAVDSPQRVLVEFVSANPTGPLTAAGGRHAAYGDAVARLLEAVGHAVSREYYVNDTGGQVERFGASIAARMLGEEPPEDAYRGDYVEVLAERATAEGLDPSDTDAVASLGIRLILEQIKDSLHRYGVDFDAWFSERSLYESGEVEATLEKLRATGHTYESEGALWLRTTEFGDDKDRVLVRAGGEPTYLASDVAYHADKLERGYERLIDVLGADHHGYVLRMGAAIAALGADPEALEARLMQFVHVIEGAERAQMSKRRGDFVTLDELLDDIGVDATRFFMLQRSHDTTIDLDLDLARRESSENPVYYVQYAHARIASILRKAGAAAGSDAAPDPQSVKAPVEPAERALIKRLLEFGGEVQEAADRRAPHRICAYAQAVATDFHAFYRDCKVVGAEGEGVEQARLQLCMVTKRAIADALGLLGISAPERM